MGLDEHALEGKKIAFAAEHAKSSGGAVEHVIDESARDNARDAGHML
jgi:hypothetical protein